ncbi:MAG TPA: malonate decarboxylase subunit alpha [bacterium]|nr:malonate decarboxylase subunit alpha [bacterium]
MAHSARQEEYQKRCTAGAQAAGARGKFVPRDQAAALLGAVIRSGDRVCLEGDNQKQADFLARTLVTLDPQQVHDLHMVQSSVVLPEHLEVFRKGIARRLDFAYSAPQSKPLAALAVDGTVRIGAIHTYLELYGRYFVDLTPQVALIVAEQCDARGNLFTGNNTEDTPTIAEATHFSHGVVIVQVKEQVGTLPRVDIPADWVDFVIVTGEGCHLQPLFTRDPAKITSQQVLMAMLALKGIYREYQVQSLNHGIGYATAAIELLLPTYGVELGLKGTCCTHWVLNPHPALIPAIEAGFVQRIHSFGGEPGMERYVRARRDIFFIGSDGYMRSNRCAAHFAGLYAIDLFIGSTLQIDPHGNSSTAIRGMIAGFGGGPNLGGTAPGQRHISEANRRAGTTADGIFRPRKLVVQMTPTVSEKKKIPVFVDELDAVGLARDGVFAAPPVMITGDQVTHILTETGIAYLDRCPDAAVRRQAIAAVAGDTPVGRTATPAVRDELRRKKLVQTPQDLGIDPAGATPERLAARSIADLVRISGGLYDPPAAFVRP